MKFVKVSRSKACIFSEDSYYSYHAFLREMNQLMAMAWSCAANVRTMMRTTENDISSAGCQVRILHFHVPPFFPCSFCHNPVGHSLSLISPHYLLCTMYLHKSDLPIPYLYLKASLVSYYYISCHSGLASFISLHLPSFPFISLHLPSSPFISIHPHIF